MIYNKPFPVVYKNTPLAPFTTFRMGGTASFFSVVSKKEDIHKICGIAEEKKISVWILGGGSNTIFWNAKVRAFVVKMNIKGIRAIRENRKFMSLEIGAGMNWDDVVLYSVRMGFSGIEALSGIPGTAGATPIQNVGAYGQEVADVIDWVRAYDTKRKRYIKIEKEKCLFSYRNSVFRERPGRWIIYSIGITLSKKPTSCFGHVLLREYAEKEKKMALPPEIVRRVVLRARREKLPDPRKIPNAGSFFKNPIVSKKHLVAIKKSFPALVYFPMGEKKYKLAAGWLIEQAGLKGKTIGSFGCYHKNALICVHGGRGTRAGLRSFIIRVRKEVFRMFGVKLETEPVFR